MKKIHIHKYWRETKGHIFNFEQVEVSVSECMEGPVRFIEAVHTKLRRATINNAAEMLNCCYQFFDEKKSYKVRYLHKKSVYNCERRGAKLSKLAVERIFCGHIYDFSTT